MNLYVYSDESGVFDPEHNEFFAFGGLILCDREALEEARRRYGKVEEILRDRHPYLRKFDEIKASKLPNELQAKVVSVLAKWDAFGALVLEGRLPDFICSSKKTKQRYLDFVFKQSLKHALASMMAAGVFKAEDVANVYVRSDDHTTSTNETYELQEGLEEDLKYGTVDFTCNRFYPPLFPGMGRVSFELRDSAGDPLIRAADMVANRILDRAKGKEIDEAGPNLHLIVMPGEEAI